jgi:hypothetical protein
MPLASSLPSDGARIYLGATTALLGAALGFLGVRPMDTLVDKRSGVADAREREELVVHLGRLEELRSTGADFARRHFRSSPTDKSTSSD